MKSNTIIKERNNTMEYVLKYDTNSDLWTVLARPLGGYYWTQVCKWYRYKGYAERKLAEFKKGK